jgi:hypothetical protein
MVVVVFTVGEMNDMLTVVLSRGTDLAVVASENAGHGKTSNVVCLKASCANPGDVWASVVLL